MVNGQMVNDQQDSKLFAGRPVVVVVVVVRWK